MNLLITNNNIVLLDMWGVVPTLQKSVFQWTNLRIMILISKLGIELFSTLFYLWNCWHFTIVNNSALLWANSFLCDSLGGGTRNIAFTICLQLWILFFFFFIIHTKSIEYLTKYWFIYFFLPSGYLQQSFH